MALSALSWQVGFALSPGFGGFALDYPPGGVCIAAAAFCAVGDALALVVEGALPARARRTPAALAA